MSRTYLLPALALASLAALSATPARAQTAAAEEAAQCLAALQMMRDVAPRWSQTLQADAALRAWSRVPGSQPSRIEAARVRYLEAVNQDPQILSQVAMTCVIDAPSS
jgi:hypothetical protein